MCSSKENAKEYSEKLRFEGEETDANALRERATMPPLQPMPEEQQRAWMARSPSVRLH